jgi:hypothetical protein
MRCDYRCGHVRCRACKVEWRAGGVGFDYQPAGSEVVREGRALTVKAYFRCCKCGKLRALSRTGNKHNNRTKASKRKKLARVPVHEQLKLAPNSPIWFIGPKGSRREKRL